MGGRVTPDSTARPLKMLAAWAVVGLWLPYTVLNTVFPGPQLTYALGLTLVLVAIGLLRLAGVSARDYFVRLAPLSWQGAMLLLVPMLALPVALAVRGVQPWRWLDNLVYAPASALAQELFFRASLLVALAIIGRGGQRTALLLQGVLFGLWHARAFTVVAWPQALAVVILTGLLGMLWGLQVQRDRTMLYTAAQHTLFLILL